MRETGKTVSLAREKAGDIQKTLATSQAETVICCLSQYPSLVPRSSPAPIFDRLQYAKTDPFLHTASDRELKAGKAWERGYQYFTTYHDDSRHAGYSNGNIHFQLPTGCVLSPKGHVNGIYRLLIRDVDGTVDTHHGRVIVDDAINGIAYHEFHNGKSSCVCVCVCV